MENNKKNIRDKASEILKEKELKKLREDIMNNGIKDQLDYSIFENKILDLRREYYELSGKATVLSILFDIVYLFVLPVAFLIPFTLMWLRNAALSVYILVKRILLLPLKLVKKFVEFLKADKDE